jgi:hypothetical protein
MTFRLSTGLRNQLNKQGSIDRLFRGGRIEIYSGVQPASPDAAVTGTLLCTITNNSGAYTAETASAGSVTLAGSAGSVNTLTVNGVDLLQGTPVAFTSTLALTAAAVATQINRNSDVTGFNAVASSTTAGLINIYGNAGQGATPNGNTVTATLTTLTGTYVNMAGGVNSVNGLQFDVASGGVMTQLSSQTWSGLNAATGTAGWFRQYGSLTDAGALDSAGAFPRMDGAIATSGAEMNLSSTALTSGATTTISGWSMTVPAQ